MPLSIHKEALKRKPRNVRYYQPGTRGGADFINSQTEHNFRSIQPIIPVVAPETKSPITGTPSSPIVPRTSNPPIDRWHKYGSFYITVSPQHLGGEDPVIDNSAYPTITLGYAAAKVLRTTMSVIYPNGRVIIEVHGGYYDEALVFDSPYIDLEGIGMPIITRTSVPLGVQASVITITSACTKVCIDGFEIINIGGAEGSSFKDGLGLNITEGAESGRVKSDICIVNCYFHGTGTQLYSQRWAYFENCQFYSADNYENVWSYASVVVRFCVTPVQTKWTKFVGCIIAGQNDQGDTLRKGQAFVIIAKDATLTTWITNTVTGMVINDTNKGWYSRTGVIFQDSEIDGWAENYGWALEYKNCEIIGGKWINDTGSGSVHLTMYSETTAGGGASTADAFVWFNGGVGKVNYLIQFTDGNQTDASASNCWAWLRNFPHTAPTFIAGTVMFGFGAQIPTGKMYVINSSTSKAFWLNAGAPTYVDGASTLSVPLAANQEGYMNV